MRRTRILLKDCETLLRVREWITAEFQPKGNIECGIGQIKSAVQLLRRSWKVSNGFLLYSGVSYFQSLMASKCFKREKYLGCCKMESMVTSGTRSSCKPLFTNTRLNP